MGRTDSNVSMASSKSLSNELSENTRRRFESGIKQIQNEMRDEKPSTRHRRNVSMPAILRRQHNVMKMEPEAGSDFTELDLNSAESGSSSPQLRSHDELGRKGKVL